MNGNLPDYIIACVGGGSNAMGAFTDFIREPSVHLIGVEAGGKGKKIGEHAVRFPTGSVGVVEGYKSYFCKTMTVNCKKHIVSRQDLIIRVLGPELGYLHDIKRVKFTSATDKEAIGAVKILARTEGIIPALESAHAVAYAIKLAPKLSKNKIMVVNLSGRGDKDLFILTKAFKDENFYQFMKNLVEEGI